MELAITEQSEINNKGIHKYYLGDDTFHLAVIEVEFPNPQDFTQRAYLKQQKIDKDFRGRGYLRRLQGYVFEDLIANGIKFVDAYIPNCLKIFDSGESQQIDFLWDIPPVYSGSFKSAKTLLTPTLVDGTPLKSRLKRVLFTGTIPKSPGETNVSIWVEIDLRSCGENDWDVRPQILSEYKQNSVYNDCY